MSQVAVLKCQSYDQDLVDKAVAGSLELLGGAGKFIKKGDRVLLKVNLLSPKPPEAAVTTHPAVVKALIKQVKAAGGIPVVGDSSGGMIAGQPRTSAAFDISGIKGAAEELGAEAVNFDTAGVEIFDNPGGIVKTLHIAKPVLDADVIITVPKLKCHSAALFTGAVKNMYGVVPGFLKAEYHRLAPKLSSFVEVILDIYEKTKPHLAVMDAIIGMEGNGPSAGDPREVGLILASPDPVALDAVASKIIGFDPWTIKTTRQAALRGLGEGRINKIKILGEELQKVIINDFKLPSNAYLDIVPDLLAAGFLRILKTRPVVNPDLCTGCRLCIENCPVKVITLVNNKPKISYNECIECLCCQELCPRKAVILKHNNWLGKCISIMSKFKKKRKVNLRR